MRIKEIKVKNYGPIREFQVKCGDIQLIYGSNEAGKTALVDAITTALFQKKSIFTGQDRFDREPSLPGERRVTLILEHLGKEYLFPGAVKFEKLLHLPHYHLASLFIIRAGDLSLREDKKWQDRVKEFLSGTSVNVARLKEKIGEEVGLTPKGSWSDCQPLYRKSEIEDKEKRKAELLQAIDRLKQIRGKERELKEKNKRRDFLKKKLGKIRSLRFYKLHQRVKEAYSEWCRQKFSLQEYERFSEEDLDLWREREESYRDLLSTRKSYREKLSELEEEIKGIERALLLLNEQKEKFTQQKDRAFRLSLIEDAKNLLIYRKNRVTDSFNLFFFALLGTGLVLMSLFLWLTGKFQIQNLSSFFLHFGLMVAGVCLLVFVLLMRVKELSLKKKEKAILIRGKEVFPECQSITQLIEKYDNLNLGLSQIESKLEYITAEKKEKLSLWDKKEKELKILEEKLHLEEEKIKDLKDKTGLSSLSQLEDKLREKEKIKLSLQSKIKDLVNSLGTDDPLLWKEEAEREVPPPQIPEEELRDEEKFEEELSRVAEGIERLTAEITSFTRGELGRLKIEEPTQVWRELEKVESTLYSWYQEKEAALLAWDILDQVGQEMEKVFMDTLTDEKSGVSFYFKKITCGRYIKVKWQEGSIYVEKEDGEIYPVEMLSSGTQDQLFFSLRLGILKRGLSRGVFLLLDDPFLTSDTKRREEQVKVCQKLREEGWQIFYFTVDEHLRDIFSRICQIKPLELN